MTELLATPVVAKKVVLSVNEKVSCSHCGRDVSVNRNAPEIKKKGALCQRCIGHPVGANASRVDKRYDNDIDPDSGDEADDDSGLINPELEDPKHASRRLQLMTRTIPFDFGPEEYHVR